MEYQSAIESIMKRLHYEEILIEIGQVVKDDWIPRNQLETPIKIIGDWEWKRKCKFYMSLE